VEARLEEGRGRAARTEVISEHLNRHHRIRPLLARRHGYETGTLRVFGLVFAHADELGRLPPSTIGPS
jgi:hypothetical protein